VVRVAAARVCYDTAWLAASLFVKRVLLIVGARPGDDLDADADGSRALNQRARQWLNFGEQRRDVSLAAFVGKFRCASGRWGLTDQSPMDGVPCLRAWLTVGRDAELRLDRANGGIERHFA
jgi:hypothetical protein